MEKLTLKDCFKYPNARIREILEDGISEDCIIHHDNLLDMLREVDEALWGELSSCKLILRPIESLTDDEKKKYESFKNPIYLMIENASKDVIDYERVLMDTAESIDYLRSINIDIDNLKEKGVAVYE